MNAAASLLAIVLVELLLVDSVCSDVNDVSGGSETSWRESIEVGDVLDVLDLTPK